jgi:tetratricopeptide (TPR) repeat protein
MVENIISRAHVLISQKKYVEAEKLLLAALATDPEDVRVLTLLAEINLQLDRNEKAFALVNSAIAIEPDEPDLFFIKARILMQTEKYDEADQNIQQALRLDPGEPAYYTATASIRLVQKKYREALEYADQALAIDPENVTGLNVRSTALIKLNDKKGAFQTIEGALRNDPNNPHTHANYGWGLLEKGDSKKALIHFRESLKIDPNNANAQIGMVEALKANNVFYRLFLKYSFWIGNLASKYQWGVILGFYFGVNIIRNIARSNPSLQPFLFPLVGLLTLFAFSTWVITPISNLFLRLNVYGRHLLDKKQIISSNFVGISMLIFLAGIITYFIVKDDRFLLVAAVGFAMMVPLGSMFSRTKTKNILVIYAAAMAALGIAAIINAFITGEVFNTFSVVFMIGFIAYQWVANFLLIRNA